MHHVTAASQLAGSVAEEAADRNVSEVRWTICSLRVSACDSWDTWAADDTVLVWKCLHDEASRYLVKSKVEKPKMHVNATSAFNVNYTRSPAIAEGPRDAGVPVEIW